MGGFLQEGGGFYRKGGANLSIRDDYHKLVVLFGSAVQGSGSRFSRYHSGFRHMIAAGPSLGLYTTAT